MDADEFGAAGATPQIPDTTKPWAEIAAWRKAERARLIEARLAIPAEQRSSMSGRIADQLDAIIGPIEGRIVSLYWPFRGEPDMRPWMDALAARGATTALPVVIEKARPLVFRAWRSGEPLEKGVWNIPVPARGGPVQPDIVIAPLVGFDESNYRLGYGGGFFDRTLAAMPKKPMIIGIGYAMQKMATIHPQPHDMPMDAIVAV